MEIRNRAELIEYIKTFNRPKGEYSNEELHLISMAHKGIIRGERSWQWLAEYLGLTITGEQLRSKCIAQQRKDKSLPKNENVVHDKDLSDLTSDDVNGIIDDKLEKLYREKVKTNDLLSAYRKLMRDDARVEAFKELVETVSTNAEPLPEFKDISNKNASREAVALLSDIHIGAVCNNFYNKYNVEIARKRINKYADDIIKFCKEFNVYKLNVLDLGDAIQGLIHVTARIEQEMDTVNQVMTASELIAQFINKVKSGVQCVVYRSVTDNHSRTVANLSENIEQDNFSKIISWYLKERLKNVEGVSFEDNSLDDSIGIFKLDNGKLFGFAHGHRDKTNSAFQNFVGATKQYIDYIALAHLHTPKQKSYQDTIVFSNGSVMGTDSYALSLRLFTKPSQKLIIFDGDNLIDINVGLDVQ